MSTEILLVSRADNPSDDPRYQHADAPAVHIELVESSWQFDLVVNGVLVAPCMTTTDLRVLWRRLGVYLDAVNELTPEDRTAYVDLASIETTPPQEPKLAYADLDGLLGVVDGLVVELLVQGAGCDAPAHVADTTAPGVDTKRILELLQTGEHLLTPRA